MNPHIKEGEIKYTKGYGWRFRLKKVLGVLFTLIPLAIAGIIAFIFVMQPVRTKEGFIYADRVRNTAKIGEEIIVIEEPSTHWTLTPIENAITIRNPERVTVIAGPYGEVINNDGAVSIKSIDGILKTNLSDIDNEYLVEEYVVRGADGTDKIIASRAIIAKTAK